MAILTLAVAATVLTQMGFRVDHNDPALRLDAGETASFARELEFIEAGLYKTEYPENQARIFIPLDTQTPAWAQSYTWRIWNWAAMAKIITNFSDDLPAVAVMAAEKLQKIESIGASFDYNIQEVRAAAKLLTPLDQDKGPLARQSIENKIDQVAALGDSATGLPGFLNMPNVPVISAPGDLTGGWLSGATPKQVLADLHAMARKIRLNTKRIFRADTILLPPEHFAHISETTLNDVTNETILDVFLRQSKDIKNVDQWDYLSDAYNGAPMAVCYKRDPKCVKLVVPVGFEMQPPQARNLAFVVPCHARIGGVSWRQPMSAIYAVGI